MTKRLSNLVRELPKSILPASAAVDGGQYVFYVSGPTPLLCDDACREGEALILSTGGNAAVHYGEGQFAYSTDCWALEPCHENIDGRFLYYYLTSQTDQIDALGFEGSGLKHLRKTFIREYSVPEFSRQEQTAIGEVLLTLDRAIKQTEVLIAKQQRIKTGVMQDLLTHGIDEHGNLRTEQTHEFRDSSLGRIPAEWSTVKLDELVSRVGSGVTPRGGESVYTPEGVLFIRSQNVHFDGLQLNDVAYIPERIHLSMLRSEIFENDVLLNITGASIGRCCRMPKIDGCANVNQHVCTIRLLDSTEATASVLAAVIESHIGQHQIAQLNAGGNREGLNYQQVRSIMLSWPSDDSEFARIYSGIRQVADCLIASQTYLGKLRLLKTGLMQDLLTGNRRVTPLLDQRKGVAA